MSDKPLTNGRVLIIAGSDSGGGAGIQADIKTVTMLGGYAMTAITAITAQNTLGVQGIWPVSLEAIERQISSVLSDIGADTIKTGMLGTTEVIDCVAETLEPWAKDTPLIVDPVMVATSGDRLVNETGISAMLSVLVPGAELVTPNAPEAEILTGKPVDGLNGQRRAAEALLERGAKGALVKGGHIPGQQIFDVLQTTEGEWVFESRRVQSTSTHGTGCTLASAAAVKLAQDAPMPEAVEAARDYVRGAIAQAPGYGNGHGPLAHGWPLGHQKD